ncbi:aldose 1-epimerase [Sandaracinobacter neustonicus]|uniref:Aldose 1-epimerase n=1 Tax=Sandaracinobacter neustonicus TaxID=1715348 RepID=A0A501XRA9_9SPHN|nr:aldose 1-epimerase [Sandaracinobacter neustonicus]TPE62647.1 aldose 1-epimerase [Sandaracinobacter neustonicus]
MRPLAADGWELTLLPELGGSIGSLSHKGRDILRPTPPGATDPLQTACFPLLPYVNRIAQRSFNFGGRRWLLSANFGDHPHSLHGVGWHRAWEVTHATAASATLSLKHPGGNGWPWPFHAEQRFALLPDGLSASLSIRNLADEPVPAGLGFHPYFPRFPDSRLQANLSAAWTADATQLPLARVPADHFGNWAEGDSLTRPSLVDNAHEGWTGPARISGGGGLSTLLSATGADGLHLYIPPGEDFFCAEPVTHLPDAINREGMDLLAPGQTLSIEMRILQAAPGSSRLQP